ncbi:MAG TPA: hypothetical protein VFH95_06630 [Candidatus Kapabacteria bacterium]|nr:hypothetical protein [Candidatus Kapabacteria bacterium]
MKSLSLGVIIGVIVLLSGCSSSNQPVTSTNSGPWNPNTQTYQVTYSPNTVLVDSTTAKAAIFSADTSYDPNDSTAEYLVYHMDPNSATAQNLAAGQILLIYGQSIRHVDSVGTNGSETLAYTSDAALTDAIQSGNISWDYGFDYGSNDIHPSIVMPKNGRVIPMQQMSGNTFQASFSAGPYSGTIQMTLAGQNAQVSITLQKGTSAKLTCNGTIGRFRQQTSMTIASNQLQVFQDKDQGVNADLTLNATVAGSGNDLLGKIELPVVLLEVPFEVGPIPVVIEVSAEFVIENVVPFDGSAQLETHFTYNSDLGFQFDGTQISANGQIGSYNMTKNKDAIGASGDIGVNFGINFPKIELQIMHKAAVVSAQTGILAGGNYTSYPPCKMVEGAFVGSVDGSFSFFGLGPTFGNWTKELWNQADTFDKVGNCP